MRLTLKCLSVDADLAVSADGYNPSALVNKGNCVFVTQDYERATDFYNQALSVDAACPEALYNLGLCQKHM